MFSIFWGTCAWFWPSWGLYGVKAYLGGAANTRDRIRMALGAASGMVLRLFMREGSVMLLERGSALGLVPRRGPRKILSESCLKSERSIRRPLRVH